MTGSSQRVGAHITISKGLPKAADIALELGANTFQFFPRNPRGGAFRTIPDEEIEAWQRVRSEAAIDPIIAHVPYTVNMASASEKTREFAEQVMREDWLRCIRMGAAYMVVHPGSYVKPDRETGIERIIRILNRVTHQVWEETPQPQTRILLETMAGQGTEIGATPDDLGAIINHLDEPSSFGVCFDSCHVFASGADIRTRQGIDAFLETLDARVGLDCLHLFHLNDSRAGLGSHKDRHANLGEGHIGDDGIEELISHPVLRQLPLILETPVDDFSEWKPEIEQVRQILSRSGSQG